MNPTTKQTVHIIRFIDRHEAKLPEFFLPTAAGVVVAGPELLRASELSHGPHRKLGWRMMDEKWGISADGDLQVAQLGEYWFMARKGSDVAANETLVEAFEGMPVCTTACRDAMLLAEYCNPKVGHPLPGRWTKFR